MFTNPEWRELLSGERFSNGGSFQLKHADSKSRDRLDVLETIAHEKRVIHFGCADHVPLIRHKLAKNRWLHSRLANVCAACIGLDIDADAIEFIKSQLGRRDCHTFDLFNPELPSEVASRRWDIVLIGEVLEHVDDPVDFLKQVTSVFSSIADLLVVTVPNGLSFENTLFALRNKEVINTDHRYWFSPFTISKVGARAGLKISAIHMCGGTGGRSYVYRWITRRLPMMRETIVAEFDL